MSRIDEIVAQLQHIASNPNEALEQYRRETGKGAVGIIYVYGPEEIIHAAGYLPVGLWGGHLPISKARAYLPSYACSLMQAVMELECGGGLRQP